MKINLTTSEIKVAVCEYLLKVNVDMDGSFIPPTAICWIGNGIVGAIADANSGIVKTLNKSQQYEKYARPHSPFISNL